MTHHRIPKALAALVFLSAPAAMAADDAASFKNMAPEERLAKVNALFDRAASGELATPEAVEVAVREAFPGLTPDLRAMFVGSVESQAVIGREIKAAGAPPPAAPPLQDNPNTVQWFERPDLRFDSASLRGGGEGAVAVPGEARPSTASTVADIQRSAQDVRAAQSTAANRAPTGTRVVNLFLSVLDPGQVLTSAEPDSPLTLVVNYDTGKVYGYLDGRLAAKRAAADQTLTRDNIADAQFGTTHDGIWTAVGRVDPANSNRLLLDFGANEQAHFKSYDPRSVVARDAVIEIGKSGSFTAEYRRLTQATGQARISYSATLVSTTDSRSLAGKTLNGFATGFQTTRSTTGGMNDPAANDLLYTDQPGKIAVVIGNDGITSATVDADKSWTAAGAQNGGYRMRLNAGTDTDSAVAGHRGFGVFGVQEAGAGETAKLASMVTSPAMPVTPGGAWRFGSYDYVQWGDWTAEYNVGATAKTVRFGQWVAGETTSAAQMAGLNVGNVTYSGKAYGHTVTSGGVGSFDGNFSLSGNLSGGRLTINDARLTNITYGNKQMSGGSTLVLVPTTATVTSPTFSGHLTGTGVGGVTLNATNSRFDASLFGPQAQNVGGNFTYAGTQGGTSVKSGGVFMGQR